MRPVRILSDCTNASRWTQSNAGYKRRVWSDRIPDLERNFAHIYLFIYCFVLNVTVSVCIIPTDSTISESITVVISRIMFIGETLCAISTLFQTEYRVTKWYKTYSTEHVQTEPHSQNIVYQLLYEDEQTNHICTDTREMIQPRSTDFPRHQKKERWGEIRTTQIWNHKCTKNCNRRAFFERPVGKL